MSRRAAFIYDDAMTRHELRRDHPMRPVRLQYTYDLLQSYGAFDQSSSLLVPPRPATQAELERLHSAEYISAVQSLSLGLSGYEPTRFNFSNQGDNPIYRGMYDAAALSTGASLVAAEMVAAPAAGDSQGPGIFDPERPNMKDAVKTLEVEMISKVLEQTRGNQIRAAKTLGISREGLRKKMARYNLERRGGVAD